MKKMILVIALVMMVLKPFATFAFESDTFMSVFVGGSYQNTFPGSPEKACYWQNGKIHTVEGISVDAITTYNGKVFAAGRYSEFISDDKETAYIFCYWVDGMPYPLPDCIIVLKIRVVNGDVYVLGGYNNGRGNEVCYWVNGVRHSGPKDGTAFDFTVVEGAVYLSGVYKTTNSIYACFWENGKRHDLPNSIGFVANGIYIIDDKIYVGAISMGKSNRLQRCFWIDGNQFMVPDFNEEMTFNSFQVDDGYVYFVGDENYWFRGNIDNYKAAGAVNKVIACAYGKIFVAGSFVGLGKREPCYWIDGKRHNLDGLRSNHQFSYSINTIHAVNEMLYNF